MDTLFGVCPNFIKCEWEKALKSMTSTNFHVFIFNEITICWKLVSFIDAMAISVNLCN